MTEKPILSRLDSWIAWRNEKTQPFGATPFNLIKEELGLSENAMLSHTDFSDEHKLCPFCRDIYGLVDHGEERLHCICQLSVWQNHHIIAKESLELDKIRKTSFDTIKYPPAMPMPQIQKLRQAVKNAKRFIIKPNKWFLMSGTLGTGKTHILKAIYASFEPIAIFIASGHLETLVHNARKQDTLGELYDVLAHVPLLLIDDLGVEYGGPLVKSQMQKIIDYRYENFPHLPVAMTTNLRPSEIAISWDRTGDRITDRARVVVSQLSGKSYRQLKPEERNG